jgi:hypothetical protein
MGARIKKKRKARGLCAMAEPLKDNKKKSAFESMFDGFGDMGGIGQIFKVLGQIFSAIFGSGTLFGGGASLRRSHSSTDDPVRQNSSPTPSLIDRGRDAIGRGWDAVKAKFVSDMPANEKYIKAHRSGNDTVFTTADGDQVVKVRESTRTASRSWANNNPGNIEFGNFAQKFGAIGTDGRFAIFPTVEAGFEAQKGLLRGESYRNLTLRDAIYRWAPPSENDSAHYARTVASRAGLNENTRIRDMSNEQLDRMVRTMASHEGWKAGKVAVIDNSGTQVALAGGPRTVSAARNVQVDTDPSKAVAVASIGSAVKGAVASEAPGISAPVLRQRESTILPERQAPAVALTAAPSMSG